MRIYLAARYSRREELNIYAEPLRALGYTVDARWLLGVHQAADDDETRWAEFAQDDIEDLVASDIVVSFTEPPRSAGGNRGGRHVEHGMALALGKTVCVVGPAENVFHAVPQVRRFKTFPELYRYLDREAAR